MKNRDNTFHHLLVNRNQLDDLAHAQCSNQLNVDLLSTLSFSMPQFWEIQNNLDVILEKDLRRRGNK
jgi:hypothetical protein